MKTVLFGAFDRHNLGDILLAAVAAEKVGAAVTAAGLAERDMSSFGGPRVLALASLREPIRLIHVGGELLDCDAAQAAWMLGQPGLRWGRAAPYVVGKSRLPAGSRVEFHAVGGVGLAARDAAFREEVLAALRTADFVTVRDSATQGELAAAGIVAPLVPDPVTRIAALFGPTLRARRLPEFPSGYLAVQFAAECGDDATLAAFARGLELIGLPVVLFRAGAAPWHDDLEPYQRLASRLAVPVRIFESLDVRDICALIAASRGCIATSLHARIVAESFGVPALTLEREPGSAQKVRAYLDTWSPGAVPLDPAAFAAGGFGFPATIPA
ncbi:polysaccharide pyruvyl transferase family protein [Sulfurisoma sediminicola]|uniref:Polysaccharide pyruvyl transferase WcaK-like protein n=1 Tax=Sulfurisoma sediminicola TaxID=1381557 RepID=A0A497XDM2_9PROT|nr:polysaccharide pyruvyl transferase family protein [Sulfurisoma sediminicola]RLJ65071.1 polysaccharide pyruvyl transferase WcaK-like protein [Sulfurisoma sediminicola]